MRLARRGALIALLFVCGLSGCATARQVAISPEGGCVAIKENSDVWPYKYHTAAIDLIKQNCPNGYVIVKEEEEAVGPIVAHRHGYVTQAREWHIYYRKAGSPVTVAAQGPPVSRPVAAPAVVPVSASVPAGLPPAPVPVGQ
jgi:hypothetical protein